MLGRILRLQTIHHQDVLGCQLRFQRRHVFLNGQLMSLPELALILAIQSHSDRINCVRSVAVQSSGVRARVSKSQQECSSYEGCSRPSPVQ